MRNDRHLAFFGLNGYLLFALILVVYTAARFLNLPLSGWEFAVAVALAAGVKFWFYRRLPDRPPVRRILVVEVGFAVMFLLALAAVTVFYDKSFDGRAYHQETILQLMDGYNPIYGSLDEAKVPGALWINHYAKGCESVAAVLYALTGNIETSKVFGLVFLLSNIALGISVLGRWGRLPRGFATVVSLILALNPVVVNQVWTHYVDGPMASLLLAAVWVSFLLVQDRSRLWLVALVPITIALCNVKFTAMVYLFLVFAVLGVALFRSKAFQVLWASVVVSALAVVLALTVVGFNPYVTNTLQHGNPLYPLAGEGKVDIMTFNIPPEFLPKSMPERFVMSFFGKTANMASDNPEKYKAKIPFTVEKDELLTMVKFDIRIGGFGPFFSGIALVSLALFLFHWGWIGVQIRRRRLTWAQVGPQLWLAALAAVTTASIFLLPEYWWARYVPQMWAVPVLLLVSLLAAPQAGRLLAQVVLGSTLVFCAALVGANVAYNTLQTLSVRYELELMAERKVPFEISFNQLSADRLKLDLAGIEYHTVPHMKFFTGKYHDVIFGWEKISHNDEDFHKALLKSEDVKTQIRTLFGVPRFKWW